MTRNYLRFLVMLTDGVARHFFLAVQVLCLFMMVFLSKTGQYWKIEHDL